MTAAHRKSLKQTASAEKRSIKNGNYFPDEGVQKMSWRAATSTTDSEVSVLETESSGFHQCEIAPQRRHPRTLASSLSTLLSKRYMMRKCYWRLVRDVARPSRDLSAPGHISPRSTVKQLRLGPASLRRKSIPECDNISALIIHRRFYLTSVKERFLSCHRFIVELDDIGSR